MARWRLEEARRILLAHRPADTPVGIVRDAERDGQQVVRTTLGEHYGTINAENLRRAHAFIESGKARGKIVLEGF